MRSGEPGAGAESTAAGIGTSAEVIVMTPSTGAGAEEDVELDGLLDRASVGGGAVLADPDEQAATRSDPATARTTADAARRSTG